MSKCLALAQLTIKHHQHVFSGDGKRRDGRERAILQRVLPGAHIVTLHRSHGVPEVTTLYIVAFCSGNLEATGVYLALRNIYSILQRYPLFFTFTVPSDYPPYPPSGSVIPRPHGALPCA